MIGPGWLPRYRPRGLTPLRRTFRRVRVKPRIRSRAVNHVIDRTGPGLYGLQLGNAVSEFPIATARPREARGRLIALVGALQRWLVARWQWLRPRSVPCAVAGIGMLAVLAFSDYLAHYKEHETLKRVSAPSHIEIAPR